MTRDDISWMVTKIWFLTVTDKKKINFFKKVLNNNSGILV